MASVLNILDDELIKNVGDFILRLVSRKTCFNFETKYGFILPALLSNILMLISRNTCNV